MIPTLYFALAVLFALLIGKKWSDGSGRRERDSIVGDMTTKVDVLNGQIDLVVTENDHLKTLVAQPPASTDQLGAGGVYGGFITPSGERNRIDVGEWKRMLDAMRTYTPVVMQHDTVIAKRGEVEGLRIKNKSQDEFIKVLQVKLNGANERSKMLSRHVELVRDTRNKALKELKVAAKDRNGYRMDWIQAKRERDILHLECEALAEDWGPTDKVVNDLAGRLAGLAICKKLPGTTDTVLEWRKIIRDFLQPKGRTDAKEDDAGADRDDNEGEVFPIANVPPGATVHINATGVYFDGVLQEGIRERIDQADALRRYNQRVKAIKDFSDKVTRENWYRKQDL